jgi:chitinase
MAQSMKNLTNLLQAKSQGAGETNGTHARGECCLAIEAPYRSKPLLIFVWPWLLILMLVFGVQNVSAQTTWSMGYYFPAATGGIPALSTIQWSALTHVGMVGGNPNSDGSVTLSSGFASQAPPLISTAHANGVKVLFVLTNLGGGTNFNGAASSGNLSTFLANIMSTVNAYGFDGVDIDWEESWNTTEVSNLASGLRAQLGTKILTADNVTVAGCPGGTWTPAMIGNLDRIAILTYDLNGSWNSQTWFNSPLYSLAGTNLQSVDSDIRAARSCGYPMGKVSIGLPFYGYSQTPSNGPYQSFGSSPKLTQVPYSSIVANYGTSGSTYDTTAHEPWKALSGANWLQWDDPQSITDKVNYVQTNGLGGWVIWILGWDYLPGSTPQDPLLDAIGKASASRPQPPTNIQVIIK